MPENRPLVVGLTGGIGSGKSTVSALFAELGVPVLDADELARELVEPGQPALAAVVEAFGGGVLARDGRLDRARLRRRVFANPEERHTLESILHPRIRAAMREWVLGCDAAYCVLVIPLLLESGQRDLVDRVLVVDVAPQVQVERVRARDGTPEDTVRGILASQLEREERLAQADDVVPNEGSRRALGEKVRALHRRYRRLAAAHLPAADE